MNIINTIHPLCPRCLNQFDNKEFVHFFLVICKEVTWLPVCLIPDICQIPNGSGAALLHARTEAETQLLPARLSPEDLQSDPRSTTRRADVLLHGSASYLVQTHSSGLVPEPQLSSRVSAQAVAMLHRAHSQQHAGACWGSFMLWHTWDCFPFLPERSGRSDLTEVKGRCLSRPFFLSPCSSSTCSLCCLETWLEEAARGLSPAGTAWAPSIALPVETTRGVEAWMALDEAF